MKLFFVITETRQLILTRYGPKVFVRYKHSSLLNQSVTDDKKSLITLSKDFDDCESDVTFNDVNDDVGSGVNDIDVNVDIADQLMTETGVSLIQNV